MEIKRDFYLDKLIRWKGNGLVKIITGVWPRQAVKRKGPVE